MSNVTSTVTRDRYVRINDHDNKKEAELGPSDMGDVLFCVINAWSTKIPCVINGIKIESQLAKLNLAQHCIQAMRPEPKL